MLNISVRTSSSPSQNHRQQHGHGGRYHARPDGGQHGCLALTVGRGSRKHLDSFAGSPTVCFYGWRRLYRVGGFQFEHFGGVLALRFLHCLEGALYLQEAAVGEGRVRGVICRQDGQAHCAVRGQRGWNWNTSQSLGSTVYTLDGTFSKCNPSLGPW